MAGGRKNYTYKDIKIALEKKGFINPHSKKHHYMVFIYNGQKTEAHTSLNMRLREVPKKGMLNTIASQIYLSKKEFLNFIECPLTMEDYIEILRKEGII